MSLTFSHLLVSLDWSFLQSILQTKAGILSNVISRYSSLMRFNTLFSGALVATSAVNILLASAAHAGFPPNGWKQVGQGCFSSLTIGESDDYHKLQKKSDNLKYGVYRNKKNWVQKGITLDAANAKMNEKCNTDSY